MGGKFEMYVRKHREELDQLEPPDALWTKIEAGLVPVVYKRRRMMYWQVAAVVFFVLSIGLLIKNYQVNNELNTYALKNSEFANTEQYYFKVIHDKESLLMSSLEKYPNLASDFKNDLKELTSNYQNLKTEFDKTGSEEVLNALIINLRLQQELLNNQLDIINLIKQENENISI
jgi:hypothetical protein